jgi:hypothetical protein
LIEVGAVYNSRRVLRFVDITRSHNRRYEVECLNCDSPPEIVQAGTIERSKCAACARRELHGRQRAPLVEPIARMSQREMERLMRKAVEYGLYGRG